MQVNPLIRWLAYACLMWPFSSGLAQSTAFTYQGRLSNNQAPVTGVYDFEFRLFNAAAGGAQQGATVSVYDCGVTNGLFTVTLDFGVGAFSGGDRWLEIATKPGDSFGGFSLLSPRQPITSVPYAVRAGSAAIASAFTGTITSSNIAPGSITGGMLAPGSVQTSSLADGAVTAAKLVTGTDPYSYRKYLGSAPAWPKQFGAGLLAVDADRLLIGEPFPNTSSGGMVYLMSAGGDTLGTFNNPLPSNGDEFGSVLALLGSDLVVIGAPGENRVMEDAGIAYLFNLGGSLITTFTNPAPFSAIRFGSALAALGSDRVLVGAAGAAYIVGTNGSLLTTIPAPASVTSGSFGGPLAVLGTDTLVISESFAGLAPNTISGAIHLLTTNGTWVRTINNPNPGPNHYFGSSLGVLPGARLLVGAPGANLNGTSSGAAYLLSTNGAVLATFLNPNPAGSDSFGESVAFLAPDRVAIGAPYEDGNLGAAYVFNTNGLLLGTYKHPEPEVDGRMGRRIAAFGPGFAAFALQGNLSGAVYAFGLGSYMPGLISDGVRRGGINSGMLASGVVTTDKLADNSVTSAKVLDGTIINADISPSAGIADSKLATIATPSKVANSATTATAANTANTIVARDGSGQFLAGGLGLGIASPQARLHVSGTSGGTPLLQVGDTSTPDTQGMMRFASRSGTGPSSRFWDIGVPEGDQTVTGKFYSFVVDDPNLGSQPELTIRWDTGNVGIGTTDPQSTLHVNGAATFNGQVNVLGQYLSVSGSGNEQAYMGGDGAGGDIEIGSRNAGVLTVGFWNSAAGTHMNVVAKTFNPTSDRNAKQDFQEIDAESILQKVIQLPVTEWAFKDAPGIRHLGPVAQDFQAAFGLGASDKSIATVDADGVVLAAIQGLNRKLEAELVQKQAEIEDLKQRLERLEQLLRPRLDPGR